MKDNELVQYIANKLGISPNDSLIFFFILGFIIGAFRLTKKILGIPIIIWLVLFKSSLNKKFK